MKNVTKMFVAVIFSIVVYFSISPEAKASYAVIDAETGRILSGSNAHAQMPIASLTKIWTALIAIENSELDETVSISQQAALSEGSSIYLNAGETVSVETLLYGLMLRSGNDAAYALAEHSGSSIEGFVDLMNEKAQVYRLNQTRFTNPSGLHHDLHLSSAYNTALMLKFAMENEHFKKIASTINYKSTTANGTTWANKHRLLREQTGAIAGKTGFTKVAGRTLATYFEEEQKKVIVVTLNESNDWQVHKQLARTIFDHYNVVTVVKKGNYKAAAGNTVQLKEPIKLLLNEQEEEELKNVLHLSRNKENDYGLWHVFINNERIYTTRVPLKK